MPMKSETKINDYQACFEDYRGKKIFLACHPKHRSVKVCAPDRNSAIVTAAKYWGAKWTSYSFYAYCEVSKC